MSITSKAELEAQQTLRETKEKAKKINHTAEQKLQNAHDIAKKLESDAIQKAKEIAGDAWEAKNNSEHYEQTVKAMKNIILGYGDEYLLPNRTVLDELAEEYDHEQAGRDLKNVREIIKGMLKRGEVANCDYAEKNRRSSAIHFATDAFNGKVATILAKAKHDNYGVLLQELKDAYSLVNHNGAAFRNVRIEPRYFDVIIEQLRLAISVQELKRKDMEEQRVIKEQMREEEKARREYEKARKEAEKEERLIQKAMKDAEAKLAEASEEKRAVWEAKISELHKKLEDAEARGLRAISMAQKTKQGHVYIISNIGSFGDDVFKIGLTRRLEPLARIKELGDASVPFSFDVHAMIFSDNAPTFEKELHKYFEEYQVNKVNPRKEFFKLPIHDIKEKIDSYGFEVHWTLKAEALQYRESIQIEKSLETNEVRPRLSKSNF